MFKKKKPFSYIYKRPIDKGFHNVQSLSNGFCVHRAGHTTIFGPPHPNVLFSDRLLPYPRQLAGLDFTLALGTEG